MQLEIDFNNPRILKGYLEQALPQYGLEEVGVTVGRNGGLAYLLFKNDDWQRLPRELKVNTMNQIDAFRGYFDAVQSYVTAASVHAERFGFALVTVDGFQVLSPGLGRDSSVYQSGIGTVSIGSVDRFEDFLRMVVAARKENGILNERYVELGKSAGALQDSRR
ncbi:hypothetical protein J4210_00210 [Candidatus Woesearchaeota archaeon]|nr:hypothetical protein [Candidatus Woesearchaeota archaeon]